MYDRDVNVSDFSIWQGLEYARVRKGSEHANINLISFWISLGLDSLLKKIHQHRHATQTIIPTTLLMLAFHSCKNTNHATYARMAFMKTYHANRPHKQAISFYLNAEYNNTEFPFCWNNFFWDNLIYYESGKFGKWDFIHPIASYRGGMFVSVAC